MKIRILGQQQFEGTFEFMEGEILADKSTSFFVLATNEQGEEVKIFFDSESPKEHEQFIDDLKRVLRH